MERSEAETRQRYTNQIKRLEKEIVQLKKRIEQEVDQRHALERKQDVSTTRSNHFVKEKYLFLSGATGSPTV